MNGPELRLTPADPKKNGSPHTRENREGDRERDGDKETERDRERDGEKEKGETEGER